ncbi:MAG: PAS domain-containing protein, partial [Planctomycetia bacterium]|nr:PAS domain-containing protein [Planctomycetia bacterium]
EQELAETQRRCVESLVLLDTLLDKAPVGLAFLDRDFSYVRVNGALAAINGLPAAAHQGRTVADVVPAVWSQLEPILRGLLVGGEPVVNSEITGETAAAPGQTRHWLSSYYPVRIADEIVGIGVIVNEVTQQRQMQQQLQQAQKMEAIGTLAGGVAHEFNNLLQIVGGYSDLMLLRLQPPDPFFDHVRQIKKAADRAAALTQELLAFGRKQLLSPKVLDPNDLVTQVAKLLRHLLDASVELVLSLKPRIGWVEVDPDQLEQALVNLALHARHAMPQGGRLTLETSGRRFDEHYRHLPPGDYVLVQVSDTGPGMDAQTLDRIFEPFFAARPGVRESGIGLAGVYGVVRQSGGHIYAASAPDRGTVYSIYLPQVAPAPADHAAADLSASAPGGTETLLLAANDELLRNYANLLLQAAGYQVLEAEANDRARTLAARHEGPIHLLLVEVGGDHQWVADLQQSRPETKVLFLLATAETAAPVPGASLRLPFAPPVLLQKVREVLDE